MTDQTRDIVERCAFCPDWTAWENDLKRASTKDAEPISDEELERFRHALADVHCKSSSAERHEVEYRLQRFGAKMWRKILARLDAAEGTDIEALTKRVAELEGVCGDALELLNQNIITADDINRVGKALDAALSNAARGEEG
jgi:uncharacterized protein YhdP